MDVITSVAYTTERDRFLDFSRTPLLTVWGELYVTFDSEIDSITSINQKRIAIMKDDFNAAYFMEMIKKFNLTCEFIEVAGFEDVFKAVANKDVDAGVVNSTFGTPKQVEYKLRPTGVVFNPFDVFFAVGQGKNAETLQLLERYLTTWRHQENSVYNQARQKWSHGTIGFTKVIPQWIGYAIIALITILIIFVAFIVLLRKKVKQATASLVSQQNVLRANQALLQSSIESPEDMIILAIDQEYKYLCFNTVHKNVMIKAYGKQIEVGMNLLDCISEESDRIKAKCNYDKALQGKSHITVEEYGEKGRNRSYYETRYNPIILDGKIIGTTAFSADVTARIQVLEELRESEEKYRTLSDISIDAIFVNQNNRIVYLNPAAMSLFGAEKGEEILGRSPLEFFHPDYRDLVSSRIDTMMLTGDPVPLIEEKVLRLDGGVIDVEVAAIPFSHGGMRSIQVILRDITERKRAEQEIKNFNATLQKKIAERTEALEKANQELESFSHSVSHDLRAPLRTISGFSELLEENCEGKLDAEGTRLLSIIKSNTHKMDNLIQGLLNLSKVKKGDLRYTNIDMTGLVTAIFAEISSAEIRQGFDLSVHALPNAWGDETLIGQVWSNLLSNAVKYSMKSAIKKIEIGTLPDDLMTIYFVRDKGAGFDPQYSDKLFEAFQRLHSAEQFEGIGIGLSIVRHIVERHRGRVWAEGNPHEGACFYFSLPKRVLESPEGLREEHEDRVHLEPANEHDER